MDQYELVRTGYRVYGQSISELARLTGHSRNTIKSVLSASVCARFFFAGTARGAGGAS